MKDYRKVTADEDFEQDLRSLVRLSIAEDLRRAVDWTSVCLIDADREGRCQIVPRQDGVCAGLVTVPWIIDEFDADLHAELLIDDGEPLVPGQPIACLYGNVRDLLTSERTVLNILCRLCGVATLTRTYVSGNRRGEIEAVRYSQDDPRLAVIGEVRRRLRRRPQSSNGIV